MSAAKKKVAEKTPEVAQPAPAQAQNDGRRKLSRERLMNVLLAPHMSEKSARVSADGNQFVFRVRKDATRSDVKDAVQLMFDVRVMSVQVLNQPGKTRRFGRIEGERSGYKKAYVRLAAGQTIDFAGDAKP